VCFLLSSHKSVKIHYLFKTDKALFILDDGFGSSRNSPVIQQCIWVCHSSVTAIMRVFVTDDNLLVVQFLCCVEIIIVIFIIIKFYLHIHNGNSDMRT
jgi:hypothetical protein